MRGRIALVMSCLAVLGLFASSTAAAVTVAAIGDCEKIGPQDPIPACDYVFDSTSSTIKLFAAKNEVVAFQLAIKSDEKQGGGDVRFADLAGPAKLPAESFTAFLETYQHVTRGIDAPGEFPVNADYPDPLVPLYDPYSAGHAGVAAPFAVEPGRNAIVWVDCWVRPETPAGRYKGTLTVALGGKEIPLNVDLTVWDFTLPAESHIYNFTELYRWEFEYHEKAKYGFNTDGWEKMKRYEEMLLDHRMQNDLTRLWPDMTFEEDGKLKTIDWTEYDKYAASRMDGSFMKDGPAKGARPSLWTFQFTPIWPNDPDAFRPAARLPPPRRARGKRPRSLAHEVAGHWKGKGWTTPIVVSRRRRILELGNDHVGRAGAS